MPPPLWHPPHGIFTYYLYEKTHNFFCKSESLYPDAPRPPMGDWWRKRGASYKKKRYSTEQFFLVFFLSTGPGLFFSAGHAGICHEYTRRVNSCPSGMLPPLPAPAETDQMRAQTAGRRLRSPKGRDSLSRRMLIPAILSSPARIPG